MGDCRFSSQLSQPGGRSFIRRWPLRDQEMAGSPDDAGAQAGSGSEFVRVFREQPGCFLADGKNYPKGQLRTRICSGASEMENPAVWRGAHDDETRSSPATPAQHRAKSRQYEQQPGGWLGDNRIGRISRPRERTPALRRAAHVTRQCLIGTKARVGNVSAEQADALTAIRTQPDLTHVQRKRVTGR